MEVDQIQMVMPELSTVRRQIQRSLLANGVRVLTEQMEHVRSVAIGVWIVRGSRHESASLSGISHFTEHMVFKGTPHLGAFDIARAVDSIGGNLDAFTTKEQVCFNTKVLDENLPASFALLADIVRNPAFRQEDIEREKRVVMEEQRMESSSPEYSVFNLFASKFWRGQGLGRSILGTPDSVNAYSRAMLQDFYRDTYSSSNIIVAAAGNVNHELLVDQADELFGSMPESTPRVKTDPARTYPLMATEHREHLDQVHLCIGVPSFNFSHSDRYGAYILNTVLGGGLSSRLFQSIRERQGLVYSIYSELSPYEDSGCLSVYAATSPEKVTAVLNSIHAEFEELRQNPVGEDELRRAKDYLKGSLMLSLESTASRMANIARQELYFDEFIELDTMLDKIESVTSENVMTVARTFFQQDKIGVAAVGNLEGIDLSFLPLSA
jgi:predicted Zn-dependent peptidase